MSGDDSSGKRKGTATRGAGGSGGDTRFSRRVVRMSLTIAATVILWLLANLAGSMSGIPGQVALLVDLAALAVLGWVLVSALLMWRERQGR